MGKKGGMEGHKARKGKQVRLELVQKFIKIHVGETEGGC